MNTPFKREKDNYTLYGTLFGFLFPIGSTIIDSINSYGSLTVENVLKVQTDNPLIWVIDTAPFWLGLFARLAGIRQDQLLEQKHAAVKDIATFPNENPFPTLRVSLSGEVLYSNMPGIKFLESRGLRVGDMMPESFLIPIQGLSTHNPTETVEGRHGDRVFIYNMVYIPKREYINIYSSDITDRKLQELELIKTKEKAEEASRAKSEFLSRMSHELRTPMNAILGFTQLLKMDSDQPLTNLQEDNVGRIYSAGKHLLELINEVLDIAAVESRNIKLSTETVDIALIMDEVLSISKSLANEKDVSIECQEYAHGNYFIEIDPLRFKQVVLNLVSNAIKYNRPNGTVAISYEKQKNGMIRLGVKDTGYGIPNDQKHKLFQPFERLNIKPELIEGTGIGLTISRQLIEMMKGTVGFESVVGEGSYFFIDLPLSDKAPELCHATENSDLIQPSSIENNRKKILYIEDTLENIELVRQILTCNRPHIELAIALNAHDGIKIAQSLVPDLILMDIHLPGLGGRDAFNSLQTISMVKHIPVIALISDAMSSDIENTLNMGFHSYITKPVDIENFINTIDGALP